MQAKDKNRFISLALKGEGTGTYLFTTDSPGSDWGAGGRDEGTILYKWATAKPFEFNIPEPAKSFDVATVRKAQIVGAWHLTDRGTYDYKGFDCSRDLSDVPTSVAAHLSRSGGGTVTLTLKPFADVFFEDAPDLPPDPCPDVPYVGPDPGSMFTVTQAQYNVDKGEFDPITFTLPGPIVDGPFVVGKGRLRGQLAPFTFPDEHVNKPAFEQTYSVDNRGQAEASACAHRTRTGKGYDALTAEMKARLGRLFDLLTQQSACFYFVVGHRSEARQQEIYDSWHAIADKEGPDDQRSYKDVTDELAAAHLKQPPKMVHGKWRDPDGKAYGGPAVPGTSRHEKEEAADITVIYPPDWQPNLGKFAAAARAAGLCPPWATDEVHVELPFQGRNDKKPKCHH